MTTIKIFFLLLLFTLSFSAYSQSRYLENGYNGSCFQFNTVITEDGFTTFGGSAAYSINGIMDIGFQMNYESSSIEEEPSKEWDFNFLYNIIVIKQTDYVPLSLQLEGSYGYTNISSDYLTDLDRTLEGQGFKIGASVFREFLSRKVVSFLVGGKVSYKNFVYTQVDTLSTNTFREEDLLFGGIAAVSLKPEKWPIFTFEIEMLYNHSANGIYLRPSFLIITPKF
ncbi:MAG: hypothetical protein JEY91_15780 [Spirochaetaceae bacterium]|nr:hypothetical protein [Spirochaetaceae bacterium]